MSEMESTTSATSHDAGAIEGNQRESTGSAATSQNATHGSKLEPGVSKREFGSQVGGKDGKEQPAAQAKKYLEGDALEAFAKIKVDGQEMELPVKELLRLSSLEKASQKRMEEAALTKKEIQKYKQLEQLSQQNPEKFLEAMFGEKFDSLAEARLAKRYEEMMMTPEQRKLRELEEYKQTHEQAQKEAQERAKAERQQALEAHHRQTIDQDIAAAWKDSGLPADPYFMQMIAAKMLKSSRQGKPLTAKQAAESVSADAQNLFGRLVSQTEPGKVPQLLGESGLKKIQEWQVNEAKAKASLQIGQSSRNQSPGDSLASKNQKVLTEAEWRRRHRG